MVFPVPKSTNFADESREAVASMFPLEFHLTQFTQPEISKIEIKIDNTYLYEGHQRL